MSDNSKIMDWLDDEIRSCQPALRYAEAHLDEIIGSAYSRTVRKVFTTPGYDLGIACPSLINHRVIGGNKKGKVIKTLPENAGYSEIAYDSDDKPLYYKNINKFGTEQTYFFFDYGGAVWVMDMEAKYNDGTRRYVSDSKIKKYDYDEKGRIRFYAELARFGFASVNFYEYPDEPEQPIICHY